MLLIIVKLRNKNSGKKSQRHFCAKISTEFPLLTCLDCPGEGSLPAAGRRAESPVGWTPIWPAGCPSSGAGSGCNLCHWALLLPFLAAFFLWESDEKSHIQTKCFENLLFFFLLLLTSWLCIDFWFASTLHSEQVWTPPPPLQNLTGSNSIKVLKVHFQKKYAIHCMSQSHLVL